MGREKGLNAQLAGDRTIAKCLVLLDSRLPTIRCGLQIACGDAFHPLCPLDLCCPWSPSTQQHNSWQQYYQRPDVSCAAKRRQPPRAADWPPIGNCGCAAEAREALSPHDKPLTQSSFSLNREISSLRVKPLLERAVRRSIAQILADWTAFLRPNVNGSNKCKGIYRGQGLYYIVQCTVHRSLFSHHTTAIQNGQESLVKLNFA